MNIQYLSNHDIDKDAWDRCIAGSFNGSLCAYSWFLDLICENWDALVEGRYESVMPLATKKFLGKKIICLPYFSTGFGIFSGIPVNQAKTRAFIDAIPPHFNYYRIMLNKYNPVDIINFNSVVHLRYELDLIKPYHKLAADIAPDMQRKLNLAVAHGLFYSAGLSPNDMIRFITDKNIQVPQELYQNDYRLLRTVVAALIRYKSGELFGVYDRHNELSSVSLLAWTRNQVHLIFQVIAPDNIRDYPHLFLIDRIMDKYAETNTTLLLETSGIPFSPALYRDFGARETRCHEIVHNKLPFPINMLINYRIFNTCLSSAHSSRS